MEGGKSFPQPETPSNIYIGCKYCRKCRQVDVLVPRFRSFQLLHIGRGACARPADGFLMNRVSVKSLKVSLKLYRSEVKVVSLLEENRTFTQRSVSGQHQGLFL